MKAPAYAPLFPYLAARRNAGLLAEGELVIDNFAGIGGASTGMEAALGRPVDHAINHDPIAVSLHRVNHPHSHHSVEDVWQVDPREITKGQPVALCWFSPDCKHFSKAKGAPLVDRRIRGLAWVAVRWADLVRPRVIILENVEEFQTWGPLIAHPENPDQGIPDPARKGRTFNSFVNALRRLGYEVEWRELRACDYGTPTSRKRLFLIARRDGLPIVWPEPTHAERTDARVQAGFLKPYRTAAECIDWNLPTPSIFDRKKPLVRNTMNRIAQGMRRFVLESQKPYIVTCNHSGAGFRGQDIHEPFRTIVAANEAHGLVEPLLAPCIVNKQHGNPARSALSPLSTITTNHNKNELVAAQLLTYYGSKRAGETRGQDGSEPLRTQTTENRHALVTAHLTKFRKDSPGQSAQAPLDTISAGGEHFGLIASCLVQHNGGKIPAADTSFSVDRPTRTITAQGGRQDLVSGVLIKTDNQRSRTSCTYPLTQPVPTVVTNANQAVATAHLTAYYSRGGEGDVGQAVTAPLRTVPTKGRFGSVVTTCLPTLNAAQLAKARQVAKFLSEYLTPEQLAPYLRGDLVVLTIGGQDYVLADIGMRMLTPRELAHCQGFPDDYELEQDAEGKSISKARQVRGIGNSVCPQMAEVLTRAQLSAVQSEAAD